MADDFDIPPADEMNEDFDLPDDDDAPVMKPGEEKEIGKQGLRKKLVKEGEGWDTPDNGDEVEGKAVPPFSFSGSSLVGDGRVALLAFVVFVSGGG